MKKYLAFSLTFINMAVSVMLPPVAHAAKLPFASAEFQTASNVQIALGVTKTTSDQAVVAENVSVDIKIPQKTRKVWITAYSSTPEETDDTPFITASGKTVRDGIVAANFLPIGCKIQIPSLFGNKTFVVEDRMNSRYKNSVDIWMTSKSKALYFGASYADIVILN